MAGPIITEAASGSLIDFGAGVVTSSNIEYNTKDEFENDEELVLYQSRTSNVFSSRAMYPSCRESLVKIKHHGQEYYWPANFVNFSSSVKMDGGSAPTKDDSHLVSSEMVYQEKDAYFFWETIRQNDISSIVSVGGEKERKNFEVNVGEMKEFKSPKGDQVLVMCDEVKPPVAISKYWQDQGFQIKKYTIFYPNLDQAKEVYHFIPSNKDIARGEDPVSVVPDLGATGGAGSGYLESAPYREKVGKALHNSLTLVKNIRDCQRALGILEDEKNKALVHCASGIDRTGAFLVMNELLSRAEKCGESLTEEMIKSSLDIPNIARHIERVTTTGAAVAMIEEKLTGRAGGNKMSLLSEDLFKQQFSKALSNVARGITTDYGVDEVRSEAIAASMPAEERPIVLRYGSDVVTIDRNGKSGIELYNLVYKKLFEEGIIDDKKELSGMRSSQGEAGFNFDSFDSATPGRIEFVERLQEDEGSYYVRFKNKAMAELFSNQCKEFGIATEKKHGDYYVFEFKKESIEKNKDDLLSVISNVCNPGEMQGRYLYENSVKIFGEVEANSNFHYSNVEAIVDGRKYKIARSKEGRDTSYKCVDYSNDSNPQYCDLTPKIARAMQSKILEGLTHYGIHYKYLCQTQSSEASPVLRDGDKFVTLCSVGENRSAMHNHIIRNQHEGVAYQNLGTIGLTDQSPAGLYFGFMDNEEGDASLKGLLELNDDDLSEIKKARQGEITKTEAIVSIIDKSSKKPWMNAAPIANIEERKKWKIKEGDPRFERPNRLGDSKRINSEGATDIVLRSQLVLDLVNEIRTLGDGKKLMMFCAQEEHFNLASDMLDFLASQKEGGAYYVGDKLKSVELFTSAEKMLDDLGDGIMKKDLPDYAKHLHLLRVEKEMSEKIYPKYKDKNGVERPRYKKAAEVEELIKNFDRISNLYRDMKSMGAEEEGVYGKNYLYSVIDFGDGYGLGECDSSHGFVKKNGENWEYIPCSVADFASRSNAEIEAAFISANQHFANLITRFDAEGSLVAASSHDADLVRAGAGGPDGAGVSSNPIGSITNPRGRIAKLKTTDRRVGADTVPVKVMKDFIKKVVTGFVERKRGVVKGAREYKEFDAGAEELINKIINKNMPEFIADYDFKKSEKDHHNKAIIETATNLILANNLNQGQQLKDTLNGVLLSLEGNEAKKNEKQFFEIIVKKLEDLTPSPDTQYAGIRRLSGERGGRGEN